MNSFRGKARLAMLCSDGASTRAIYNAMMDRFGPFPVIMESPISRFEMMKRRVKKLGRVRVFGQVMFVACLVPLLNLFSRRRIEEIQEAHGLRQEWGDAEIFAIDNVNSDECVELLRSLNPEVVVVNGTRIISTATLNATEALFVNTHAGITPLYRGVHGGYWALAEDRPDLVGTTVHVVDKGIDTGGIIAQAYFRPGKRDSFVTYPYLHTAFGIPILLSAVEGFLGGELKLRSERSELDSRLRYHPTIWEYLYRRLMQGVK